MKLLIINSEIESAPLSSPDVTLVTDSSIITCKNPLFLPDAATEYRVEFMPAFRIHRLGKSISKKFAARYYDAVTLLARVMPVIDGKIVRNGSAIYTAYDSAIIKGEWIEDFSNEITISFSGKTFNTTVEALRINEYIEILSRYMSMKIGDIVAPGFIPVQITPVIDSRIEATMLEKEVINIKVK